MLAISIAYFIDQFLNGRGMRDVGLVLGYVRYIGTTSSRNLFHYLHAQRVLTKTPLKLYVLAQERAAFCRPLSPQGRSSSSPKQER